MTEYDIDVERRAAIETLKSKQAAIREANNSHYVFIYVGNIVSNELKKNKNYTLLTGKNPMKDAAYKWGKLDYLIHRLENGEDPRRILLEIVSAND